MNAAENTLYIAWVILVGGNNTQQLGSTNFDR